MNLSEQMESSILTEVLMDTPLKSNGVQMLLKECLLPVFLRKTGVKSGIFVQTANFGQPHCLFHSSIIGIKNKLT